MKIIPLASAVLLISSITYATDTGPLSNATKALTKTTYIDNNSAINVVKSVETITSEDRITNNQKAINILLAKIERLEKQKKTAPIKYSKYLNTIKETAKHKKFTTGTYRVKTFYLNVRSKPNYKSEIVACFKQDKQFKVIEVQGGWGKIGANKWLKLYATELMEEKKDD